MQNTTNQWLNYFRFNRDHRLEIPWQEPIRVETRLRAALIHSLLRFQVGESGEGNHLRRFAAATGDPVYMECIDLFIREEQEHARLMAEILRRWNVRLLERHWSNGCFILLRRLFGLNEELLVLLIPEMIAQIYFRAMHDATPNPVLKAVFAQILRDEDGHVAFHVSFLRQAFAQMPLVRRVLLRLGWRILFRGACLVVAVDHFGALRAGGMSPARFWWDSGLLFDQTAAAIFGAGAGLEPGAAGTLRGAGIAGERGYIGRVEPEPVKKKLIYIGLGLVVLLLIVATVSVLMLGRIVKNRVEALGPQMTRVDVTLDAADVWLFAGSAHLKRLIIGNPSHFKTKVAMAIGNMRLRVNPLTAFSPKIVIDSLKIESPEITIEGGLKKNNLTEIEDNVNKYLDGTNAAPSAPAPSNSATNADTDRTFQVNELVISGARLHVVSLFGSGQSVSMSLPEIRMTKLGAGPDGITSAEIAQKVLTALLNSIAENAADTVSNLGKDAVSKAKKFDFKKAGEKLKGLFGQ